MARLCCFTPFLLVFFAVFLQTSESSLKKVIHQSFKSTGVFLLIDGETYTLNFTAAREACLSLNVTIATKIQMERAIQHGLEMCKYGWIAEQTAVIPRISAEQNCGQGKTGVVAWNAPPNKMFGVFCFSASALTDLETTQKLSTPSPQSSTSSTPLTALTRTTSSTHLVTSTTKSTSSTKKLMTTKSPQPTPSPSAFVLPIETTWPTTISSSASPSLKTFPTHVPVSLPPLITSKPTTVSLTFPASTHAFNFPLSTESVLLQPAKPSLGASHITLIILGIILLLLTAGTMWEYKFYIFSCLSRGHQTDDMETEMWKRTDEMDLHSQCGAVGDDDEDESHWKYSSDIMLCV